MIDSASREIEPYRIVLYLINSLAELITPAYA